MRIAVLTSSYPRFEGDGTAPFVQSLCEHLEKLGNEIEVLAPFDVAVESSYQQKFPVHRYRYIWPDGLHMMGHARSLEADVRLRPLVFVLLPFFLMGAIVNLLRLTQRQQTELIHVHWVVPNGPIAALVAALRKIPFVVSLHGSDMFIAQKNALFRWVARWVFQRACAVTVCSKNLQKAAVELGAPFEPELVIWGADPQRFVPMSKNPEWLQNLDLGKNDRIVITLGRLVPKKGFEVLLRAWAIICADMPDTHLVIGGEGPLLKPLTKIAADLGLTDQVRFAGRVPWDQVPDFLSIGTLYVLPSVQGNEGNVDGLPTVLLEAMGCGLPVIASDIAGIPEAITQDQNGLLVPAGDVDALALTVRDLLMDAHKRKRLGLAARQSVETNLNWDNVALTYTRIFDDVLERFPE